MSLYRFVQASSRLSTLHRVATVLVLLLIALSFIEVPLARAADQSTCPEGLSNIDCNTIYGNYENWIIGEASDQCAPTDTSIVSIDGNTNVEKAWNFFKAKGLSDAQAAGVIGNLIAESSLDPKADSGSHKGIAQWDAGGRWARFLTWAEDNNLDPYSLDAQLNYVWKEADARGNIDGLKKYDDYKLATWFWGRYYEVAIVGGSTSETPLTNVQNLEGRIAAAKQTLDKFGGTSSGGILDSASSSTDSCGDSGSGALVNASCTNVNTAPPNDFKIVTVPGTSEKTDQRTLYMLNVANDCLKQLGEKPLTVIQGSYCGSGCASASGSSHDKGATVDIRTRDRGGLQEVYKLLKVMREVGFAAWYRDGNDNPSFAGNEHIHAVALGAPLSGPNAPGSPDQLILYCTGGDGLHGGQKDRQLSIVGRPLPDWALTVKPHCTRYP